MATKKKILYIVEAMGGGVFTYIVDTKQQWDVKGTVVTNRSVVLYYDKVKGVAFGDTLQDYINNYLRPENGADLSLLAPGYSNHFGSGYFNQNQVVLNQPTHQ